MIEVINLTRYYGSFAALEGLSFSIDQGQIIGLLGLNGAGKSTTLKILAGLLTPSEGTVRFNGVDITENPDSVRAQIGFLPEDPPLYRDMTVVAFLKHIGQLKGMSAKQVKARLPEVIELAQLKGRENQVIGTLSHGYRKRVGIAQAVIHDPKLVILDEPISGLDPKQIVGMREVIRGLAKGRAVIVSSHILSEISQTADRILVINDGKLAAEGTEAELASKAGRGDQRVILTVKGDQAALNKFLEEKPGVLTVTPRPSKRAGFAAAIVDLKDDSVRDSLVHDVVRAGFVVWLLEAPEDELEEIFLGLTKEVA
ncbi:MAG: ABC transporter ATP-binding protein [Myxococcota bacterium]